MKYSCKVTIDLARDEVIALFDRTENLTKRRSGLQSFEHISGDPGQVGAKSRMVHNENCFIANCGNYVVSLPKHGAESSTNFRP